MVLAPVKRKKGAKSKIQHNVTHGVVHIVATFNNTKVSISDVHGNVIAWSSAGKVGFKGSRKSTAYAAQVVATEAAKRAMTYGMKEAEVWVKGPGAGRESAVRGITAAGLEVSTIKDVTPITHNGCRPPKRRRV
ncbi:MAG: 30S ribosomal protein S11 [Lentisphaeraceae bacterium]|nr:30S ribosomal protein S11 [Lentisphaeraceae bacterium]